MAKKTFLFLLIAVFSIAATHAQKATKRKIKSKRPSMTEEQQQLYNEIFKQDSVLFAALNKCDTLEYRKHLSDDLEFYHDQGGLHFLPEEMQSIKEMCAWTSKARRELLKNTLEVHKLGDFGALEIGVHRFYFMNNGKEEHGDYKFIHVWEKKEGVGKVKRVISYGHYKIHEN